MEIYPAIDIRQGRCVRLIQGDYDRQLDYADDPVAVAEAFAGTGARWLHVVDLDGARAGVPQNLAVIKQIIRRTGLHVQVGGGIRSEPSLRAVLGCGARRAIVGTAALEAWAWFDDLVHQPRHRGRIGLALDAREGMLAGRGWTQTTARRAVDVAGAVAGWPLGAIIYTDISRDGMLTGPNVEATAQVAAATDVPVIASGGVGCIDDVRRLANLAIEGIIIGRALYEKKLDLAEAIAIVAEPRGAGQ